MRKVHLLTCVVSASVCAVRDEVNDAPSRRQVWSVVWSVVRVVVAVVVVVVCVCAVWCGTLKNPVCPFKTPSVYIQNVPCVLGKRSTCSKHVRGASIRGDVLKVHTGVGERRDEVSAQLSISRERQTEWRFLLIIFVMMSSESRYKFRSEINR